MKCVFCELSEIKERKIVENELAWAFLTNIPITIGHTLVVPKRCVSSFSDMTKEEVEAVLSLGEKIKKALAEVYGAKGFNVAYNEGEVAGQTVPHFHIHIVPRKDGDEGVYGYEPREFIYRPGSRETTPEAELKSMSEEIREYF